MRFRNRREAGRQLAARLAGMQFADPVVLALPRGGVPVAFEVAAALRAPLEVFVARKVGAPGHEEFGIGAIAEGSADAVKSDSAAMVGVGPEHFEQLARREQVELERRGQIYPGARPPPPPRGPHRILVGARLAPAVPAVAAPAA